MDQDDIEDLRSLTPSRVLRGIAVLRARLEAPGSTSGLVAERCEQGLATRTQVSYEGDGGQTQRLKLAWLLGLTRDLSEVEERACAVRYSGTGELVKYDAIRRKGDVRDGDGELVLPKPEQVDYAGKDLSSPWVRVRGERERMPSFGEVAAVMAVEGWRNGDGDPMSPGAVEKLLRTASEKIATAIRARQAMAMLEDRACG